MSWRKVADCQAKYFIHVKVLEGVQRRSHRRVLGERQQADPLQDGEKHQVPFFPKRMRHEAALARIRLVRLGLVPQGSLIRHAFLELLRKEDKDNDCPILQVVQCGCLVEREPKQSLKLVLGAIACRAPLEGALASLRRQVAGLALRAQLLGLLSDFRCSRHGDSLPISSWCVHENWIKTAAKIKKEKQ